MGLFDKKHVIKIDADDLNDAKLSSIDFTDENVRKRAFIDVLGARLAMKLLLSQKMAVSNEYSLYTIQAVLEELDIADIYYKQIKIDVRLVFNKNEIFIPRSHFDYDLLPDLYVVLCLKENLSSAELVGFFEPKSLDKSNANKDFFFFESEKLSKPEKLKSFLDSLIVEPKFEPATKNSHNKEELFLSFVDKELSKTDKKILFKDLANSRELREKLVEFENFEIISHAAAKVDVLQNDGTLSFVGGKEKTEEDEIAAEAELIAKAETPSEEIITPEEETFEPESEYEPVTAEKQADSSLALNGGIIAGGAIVAAAGLGLASELAKGAANATIETAKAEGAMIAGVTDVVSAGLEFGNELINSIPDVTTEKNSDNEFLNIDELPDFGDEEDIFIENDYQTDSDDAEIIVQEDEEYDFDSEIGVEDLPDFGEVEESNDEAADESFGEEISYFGTDEEAFTELNLDEESSDLDELAEFSQKTEEVEEDEFLFAETAEESIFEQDESEVELAPVEDEPFNEFELNEELPENTELQDFSEVETEEEFTLAEPEAPSSDEEMSLEFKDEDEIVTSPEPKEDSKPAFEYVDIGNDLPDLGYLMDNDLDQIAVPNFEYLTQVNPEGDKAPEAQLEENSEEELNPFDAELPELEHLEEHPVENEGEFGNIKAEQDFLFDENLSDFHLEEHGKIDELGESEKLDDLSTEESMTESNKVDEAKEEVFSLDDFDFKLLEEDSDALASDETQKTEENDATSKPVSEEGLTFFDDINAEDKFRQLEESEDENEQPVASDVNFESDEFISQVDDLLNDTEFLEGNKALLENSLMDIEPENANAIPMETTAQNASTAPIASTDRKVGEQGDADLLNVLFENEDMEKLSNMDLEEGDIEEIRPVSSLSAKKKKMVIAASIAGVVLASFVIGGAISSKNNQAGVPKDMATNPISMDGQNPSSNGQANDITAGMNASGAQPMGQIDGQAVQSLPGEDQSADLNRDMGKAVSEAFSSDPVNATISKIAWEVPEDLAYNDSFRKYLQIAGKNLKLNLQNDLLLATEMAYSNKVIVDLKIGKDGALQSSDVLVSSGSKQIDKIVLQSVKETLSYLKLPASELNSPSVNATLIINF